MISVLEAVLYVAAAGAAATASWILYLGIRRSPTFGLVAILLVESQRLVTQSPLLPENGISVTLGQVSLYPRDLVAILLLVGVGERLLAGVWQLSRLGKLTAVFLFVSIVSTAAGVIEHDVFAAANQFRRTFYFAATLLYFSSHPGVAGSLDVIRQLWTTWAGLVVVLGVLRWMLPLEAFLGPLDASGPGGIGRPVDAATTHFILVGALMTFAMRTQLGLTFALLTGVVAFQHRSVWAAALIAIGVLVVGPSRRRVLVLSLSAIGVTAGTALVLPQVSSGFVETLGRAATSMGTFEWRVEGWGSTLRSQLVEPHHWIVGRSMGTPWDRDVFGRVVEVSPHSMYVELLLRVGIVGLAVFLAIFVVLVRMALQERDRGLSMAALAVVAGMLVYNTVYSVDMWQAAALGILASRLSRSDDVRAGQGSGETVVRSPI